MFQGAVSIYCESCALVTDVLQDIDLYTEWIELSCLIMLRKYLPTSTLKTAESYDKKCQQQHQKVVLKTGNQFVHERNWWFEV